MTDSKLSIFFFLNMKFLIQNTIIMLDLFYFIHKLLFRINVFDHNLKIKIIILKDVSSYSKIHYSDHKF